MDSQQYVSRGYLREPFRLFHLRDVGAEEMAYHYHEFDKAVIFLGGTASYSVEGREYPLRPWDVMLVRHHLIHRPIIDPTRPYERVVLYLDPGFLRSAWGGTDLSRCFRDAMESKSALLRPQGEQRGELEAALRRLESALKDTGYGGDVLARAALSELLVCFHRIRPAPSGTLARWDPKIEAALDYINAHPDADLSADALCARAFLSKYHFMRLFRAQTGYSVHRYVSEKRLLYAAALLRGGHSAQDACRLCGFGDYSAFQRAFCAQFGATPKAFFPD